MDEILKAINKYPNGTYLKIEWGNGQLILGGKIDTIYESDNGFDEDDERYMEFYVCAFRIEKIIKNFENKTYEINDLVEISIENPPTLITLQNGTIVWKTT